MTSTRSERVDDEAVTPPSSTRRPGVAGESFGDASLGSARTPPSKSVTCAGGMRMSASPQVRVPCAASGQGLVAVNSPTSRAAEAFKKRKRPPALSISNDMLTHGAGVSMRLATENDLRDAGAAEEAALPPPSALASLWGSNLPPLRFAGVHFSRDQRINTAWQLGLADREAIQQWGAGRPQRQIASPLWIAERPKAAYCVLRLDSPGRLGVYRCYETYKALTHPGGLWRLGVSRGLPTEAEARVYLEAVGLEPRLEWH